METTYIVMIGWWLCGVAAVVIGAWLDPPDEMTIGDLLIAALLCGLGPILAVLILSDFWDERQPMKTVVWRRKKRTD